MPELPDADPITPWCQQPTKGGAHRPDRRRLLLASASVPLWPTTALAQATLWPSKPVRLLTPFTAGGATDVIARSLAANLQATFKQPFSVEPKPGADGALAAQELLRQPADGHTLYLATASALSYVPNVRKAPGYDAMKDFAPLTQFVTFTFYLMVHQAIPGKTLPEALAHIKANPGKYSYAAGNSTALLGAAQLMASSGADMVHAPYKGEAQAVVDMVGDRIQMMWASPAVMPALLKDGKFRPLAVLLPERSAAFPDVPTIGEAGMPLVNIVPWGGFVVPAGTPREVSVAAAKALREAIGHPDLRAPAASAGVLLRPSSAEAFAKLLQDQLGAFATAIKLAKIPQE